MHLRSLIAAIMAFGCATHVNANNAHAVHEVANLQQRDGPTPTIPPTLATDPVRLSVLSVLVTAMPAPQLSKAIHDEKAFSAEIASSLSAGKTPEWWVALPADVKTLLPSLYPAHAAFMSAPANTSAPTTSSATATSGRTTSSGVNAPTTAAPAANTSSTGAASRPTGVVGAGIIGAMGVLGMLVL